MPARIFMSVLLPAPFSPITATSSPLSAECDTLSSAITPGKRLERPEARSSGGEGFIRVYQPLLHQLLQLFPEDVHLRLLDRLCGHFHKLARRHHAFIALRECSENPHALIAVAEGTLHDRAVDIPFLD